MQLVILSYPCHYHIAQLAVKHALQHIPNISKIFVVWDDTHNLKPEIPLSTVIKRKFDLMECPTINWSSVIHHIPGDNVIQGNVGQQIIKMYLDQVIAGDFVILDGDTIINHDIDPANIIYSNRLPFNHARYNLINHALGIPNYEYFSNTFMYMKGAWLAGMREHIYKVTGKHIVDLFDYEGRYHPIYEWELMAHYVLDILKLPKKIEYFDKVFLITQKFEQYFTLDQNIVLNGPDDFSLKFMEQHGITVDRMLMMQLNYTNA